MSEHDLRKSLLRAGTSEQPGPIDSLGQTTRIVERDRRRVRLLGAATLALWLLGAAGIGFVLFELSVYVPDYLAFRQERAGTRSIERRQSMTESSLAGFQIGVVVIS